MPDMPDKCGVRDMEAVAWGIQYHAIINQLVLSTFSVARSSLYTGLQVAYRLYRAPTVAARIGGDLQSGARLDCKNSKNGTGHEL